MREREVQAGDTGRRLAWTEWGDPANPSVLLCVHGLTRSGRDFDRIAEALSDSWRVACVDVAGRGRSDPLPPGDYGMAAYAGDVVRVLEELRPETLDWIGTSMGGLVAFAHAASAPAGSPPIRRLVLNDVGPEVPEEALRRIGGYVGRRWRFEGIEDAEAHVRAAYAPFSLRTDADWRLFAETSVRPAEGGGLEPAYDPAIGDAFRDPPPADPDAGWALWDSLSMPVLVLQGAESDVLPDRIADRMARRPGTVRHVVPGVGHAPSLLYPDEIRPVEEFLRGPPA